MQADDLRLPTLLRTNVGVERVLNRALRAERRLQLHARHPICSAAATSTRRSRTGRGRIPAVGNITQVESTADPRRIRQRRPQHESAVASDVPVRELRVRQGAERHRRCRSACRRTASILRPSGGRARWTSAIASRGCSTWISGAASSWRRTSTPAPAAPYTITTGRDDNGDTVSNDRPAGRGPQLGPRVRALGHGRATELRLRLRQAARRGRHGRRRQMIMIRGGGGLETPMGGFSGGADDKRWRMELYVAASNIFNHTNLLGYSGVMTSPFFGQATSAAAGAQDGNGGAVRVLSSWTWSRVSKACHRRGREGQSKTGSGARAWEPSPLPSRDTVRAYYPGLSAPLAHSAMKWLSTSEGCVRSVA